MVKKLNMIKDIDGNRETLKLGVRVVDHWYVHNRDLNVHFEMIFIDQKVNNNNFFILYCLSKLFFL